MSSSDPGVCGGCILVDLDGTLSYYQPGGYRPGVIGRPIDPMVGRVRKWIAEGREVVIFTARLYKIPGKRGEAERVKKDEIAIYEWCRTYLGAVVPVTCQKLAHTDIIFDDRAIRVEHNTGLVSLPACLTALS